MTPPNPIVFLVDVDNTLVDDKLRILAAVKQAWGDRVTTVFTRQGQFARDPNVVASYPAADMTVEGIGELLAYDLRDLLPGNDSASKLQSAVSSTSG